jgi:serine protease Do
MVEQFSATLRQVVASVTPSVVHIEAEKPYKEPDAGDVPVTEAGAGIIVESRGHYYVLTNHHVVRESRNDEIRIFLADERVLQPDAIWSDMATDVAVLQLPDTALPAARLGNSDQIQIGDLVLAFGSPFGLSHSVSHGIVSAKGRRNLDLGIDGVRIQDFLQTDAAINPGNSGGPLLNLRGEVIALNTAIASNSGGNDGIGFAIPINLVTQVASQLVVHGRVVRPYLGIRLDHEYDGKAHKTTSRTIVGGARVSEVSAGSPAHVAGIQVGDIIVKIDGARVEDDGHLVNLIGTRTVPGQSRLDVLRNGAIQSLSVELVERP